MKNTLSDLNNYLFEVLERLNEDDVTEEQLDQEIKRSEAVTRVAQTIILNGKLALDTMKHMDEQGRTYGVPTMLEVRNEIPNGARKISG